MLHIRSDITFATTFAARCVVLRILRSIPTHGLVILAALMLIGLPITAHAQAAFKRGDVNGDGCVSGADFTLLWENFTAQISFLNVPCQDAWDITDSGDDVIGASDLLAFFANAGQYENLNAPGGVTCGVDPTPDAASCVTYTGCAKQCDPKACMESDVFGTVLLPPEGANCEYMTADDLHMIINGLPSGTEVKVSVLHGGFTTISRNSGSNVFGSTGETETFDSTLTLELEGTGLLAGFKRTIVLDAPTQIETIQRSSTSQGQFIEAEVVSVVSDPLVGDPDFSTLTVTAGTANGLTGPGGTILEPAGSEFEVDSAFRVEYSINFAGATGSVLEGLLGSTQGTADMALPDAPQIPSMSDWGLAILIGLLLLLAVGAMLVRRARSGAA